ncbi:TonB-dependent receptor [Marinobacterium nitratireducens]|uniref:TonB-dependent receptor n=1 Tax=Marinobacterium nitratireducens TaxID=518897 RepID=A0A917ZG07_9GAMM|nr:TonB-dependent vitamin B12 receptor [Marinobacterium nitratireducens]GGO81454.1 TonB-dependent receptor [Marinobacterium nitratireducens]
MKQLSLPAVLLLGSSGVFADTGTALAPVVVTATRTAQTADATLAPVTVITREEIERSSAQMLPEVLRGVPGLTLSNTGGPGKETSIFLRGTNSNHVLVLIDGIKVGSVTTGKVAIQDLPLSQVERIELVRGPRSSLYGSEAIGGVIQIFTRRGGGDLKPRASLTLGSHDTLEGSLGLSGGSDAGWFNLGLGGLDTDGFDARRDAEPDDDGYRNQSVSLRAGRTLGERTEVEMNWLRTEADVEYDGFYNESESEQQVLGARLKTMLSERWDSTLQLGRSWDESDNFSDGVFMSRYDTRRDSASWQNDIAVGDDLLTLGLDYQNDELDSSEAYDTRERDNRGAFGQYQFDLGAHELIAALRYDDNEQFGHQSTGSLGWGYDLDRSLRLVASYGTAFRAPSFNELYFPNYGTPDLPPEESENLEVGLQGRHAYGSWSLSLFQNDIDNLISSVLVDPATYSYRAASIDSARIRGLEAVYAVAYQSWSLSANLLLSDPEDRDDGSQLRRRARRVLNVDLDRRFGDLTVGGVFHAESRRPDGSVTLAGYGTFDLRANYRLAADWTFGARVANLFDKDYETAAGYNQDDRAYYVTLGYAPR